MQHLSTADLEQGVGDVRGAPRDDGRVEMIVRRPAVDVREVLDEAWLDLAFGLDGDTWRERGSSSTADGSANPEAQVTVMSARSAELIAGDRDRWPLAGDQLFVDLDLGGANLPPGTRLVLGDAVIEVSAKPHTGCKKFAERFGQDAARFVNSPVGRELNLRGINTRVVVPGAVRVGDVVRKASDSPT
ncbi:MAG TPA: MOSC domain-containing protein [Acidimicrobiia bacterium]|jgi:hypothetical protein